jgi:multicomponent Na+:H+ antiporter subunit D
MNIEMLFIFAPFAVLLMGLFGERLKIKYIRESFAALVSLATLASVVNIYNIVQSSPTKIALVTLGGQPPLGACFEIDMLGVFMAFSAALLGLFTTIYSVSYMSHDTRLTEYYTLLSCMIVGIIGVAFAGDFVTFFVFWELMGIASYVLVAFRKNNWGPIEAGFKYMVMGAVGSTMLLLGIGLIYGMAGTVNFAQISSVLHGAPMNLWFIVAMVVFVIGFGIKSAIVPLHTWLPDAHPEAPSPISAMLSGILIETALYGLTRILYISFEQSVFMLMVAGLAAITMTFANIVAVLQKDLKRMLAYSSIAQVGYMLIGIAAGGTFGVMALVLHIFNHSLMKGLAFLSAGSIIEATESRDIENMRGISKTMPITVITMFIALLGLGGIPGTNGFISKFLLFSAGMESGLWWLVLIGALNSALSMAYYLRVMKTLIGKPSKVPPHAKEAPPLMLGVTVTMAILIILFGIWPASMIQYATEAANAITVNLPKYVKVIMP